MPLHTAQVLTYLRLTGARQALLLNFNSVKLMDGLRSFLGEGKQRSQRPWVGRTFGERSVPARAGTWRWSWATEVRPGLENEA